MTDDVLYTARDIKKILGIDQDRLYHWTQRKRLLRPASIGMGRGKENRYSVSNLFEIATIQALSNLGIDWVSLKKIKKAMDKPIRIGEQGKDGREFLIFRDLPNYELRQYTEITIRKREKRFELVELVLGEEEFIDLDSPPGVWPVHYPIAPEKDAKDIKRDYFLITFSIGELVEDVSNELKRFHEAKQETESK